MEKIDSQDNVFIFRIYFFKKKKKNILRLMLSKRKVFFYILYTLHIDKNTHLFALHLVEHNNKKMNFFFFSFKIIIMENVS